jgi:hypothetical protein
MPDWMDIFESIDMIPDEIRELMKEIYVSTQNKSNRLTAMGIRSVIEQVITQKIGDDQRTFKAKIDAFQMAGYLSVRWANNLETILEAGHASVHRGWKPTDQHIKTLLDITESIIETVYLHEDQVRKLEKDVPARVRSSPNKRT